MKRKPKVLVALFDSVGNLVNVYTSVAAARHDAVGPRFRDGYQTVRYERSSADDKRPKCKTG